MLLKEDRRDIDWVLFNRTWNVFPNHKILAMHACRFDVTVEPETWTFRRIHAWEIALLADCPKAAWSLLVHCKWQKRKLSLEDWQWYKKQTQRHADQNWPSTLKLHVQMLRNNDYVRRCISFPHKVEFRNTLLNVLTRFRYDAWDWYKLDWYHMHIGVDAPMCLICDCLLYGNAEILHMLLELAQDETHRAHEVVQPISYYSGTFECID